MSDKITPLIVKNGAPHQVINEAVTATANNPLPRGGVVFIGGGSATTVTLADPEFDGLVIEFVTITAQAHIVSYATGFNGAGAGADTATFAAAAGLSLRAISYGGVWYIAYNDATLS